MERDVNDCSPPETEKQHREDLQLQELGLSRFGGVYDLVETA